MDIIRLNALLATGCYLVQQQIKKRLMPPADTTIKMGVHTKLLYRLLREFKSDNEATAACRSIGLLRLTLSRLNHPDGRHSGPLSHFLPVYCSKFV